MAKHLKAGDKLPAFSYDTPYEPQKSFSGFLQQDGPVLMVFLPNFGHPITRHFITQYLETIYALRSVRLACVVRSRPEAIARVAPKGSLPFELICDAEGALYDYFQIPQKQGMLRCYSLEGMRIIKQARQEGYSPAKNERHQLPLTLVVDGERQVLFAHYGHSMTDLPADCSAMERVAQELRLPAQEPTADGAKQQAAPQMNGFSGFEHPDQGALTEEELLAALEENRAKRSRPSSLPHRIPPPRPRRRSSSPHLRQSRTGLPRRKAESIRRKRNPARRRSPPKHPRSRWNSRWSRCRPRSGGAR